MPAPSFRCAARAFRTAAAFVAAFLVAVVAARAETARTLTYDIRMDGDLIGTEEVRIESQGETTRVTVKASTRVRLLFLTFTYDHERTEVWRAGRLESMQARTDDDGTPHTASFGRAGDGITVTVDGKPATHPADTLPLTLWTPAVVKAPLVLSVIDGEPFSVNAQNGGNTTLDTPSGPVKARQWRLRGGVERDLWYAEDGTLLKTAFKRKGYDVTYVLR